MEPPADQDHSSCLEGENFALHSGKEQLAVYTCSPRADGSFPRYPVRRKIERQLAKHAHERILIYTETPGTSQVWQWVRHEAGRPAVCREHVFRAGQTGEALVQRLQNLAFELSDEERLTILHVADRAKAAFDVERVTKRFYERFRAEHDAFLGLIKGIDRIADETTWYASLMLNRMMLSTSSKRRSSSMATRTTFGTVWRPCRHPAARIASIASTASSAATIPRRSRSPRLWPRAGIGDLAGQGTLPKWRAVRCP